MKSGRSKHVVSVFVIVRGCTHIYCSLLSRLLLWQPFFFAWILSVSDNDESRMKTASAMNGAHGLLNCTRIYKPQWELSGNRRDNVPEATVTCAPREFKFLCCCDEDSRTGAIINSHAHHHDQFESRQHQNNTEYPISSCQK